MGDKMATETETHYQDREELFERQRMAMRSAFTNGVGVSEIAKQFEVSEREVWSAAKDDRS
jgi:DNA-directed RNA polymerase specialized sigma subunit